MPTPYSPQVAAKEPFLGTIRELVRAYQAFANYSEGFVRKHNLTPSQFDVIATLGHAQGMSMGAIGEKTLITKGTLTGVVDRLIKKGLVTRKTPPENRRSVIVQLTPDGEALFDQVFPAHIADMKQHFVSFNPSELELLKVLLNRLRQTF
ncbi:MarR family transcriptional regulator [Leptothoe sp. LEGE 181152]|uniref:MarR family transcriptional regulator n=1 Tax=Adonisia turfae CCMR0081 TaxID=2292702 RepID=A0A6M0RTD7_9CYAN|nr:MarR family transcriptional regulator [Adonisia turfae]MDV3350098.1 MarR family transcriptional regulator [Leptothoe sp. LEGE 181152]NEZ59140.1 MarR family transcriptional regulator [Adonisia turfae CCMR0081]